MLKMIDNVENHQLFAVCLAAQSWCNNQTCERSIQLALGKRFFRKDFGDWAIMGIMSRLGVSIIKNNMGMFKKQD
jgi:hypothetical protein